MTETEIDTMLNNNLVDLPLSLSPSYYTQPESYRALGLWYQEPDEDLFSGAHHEDLFSGAHHEDLFTGAHHEDLFSGAHHEDLFSGAHHEDLLLKDDPGQYQANLLLQVDPGQYQADPLLQDDPEQYQANQDRVHGIFLEEKLDGNHLIDSQTVTGLGGDELFKELDVFSSFPTQYEDQVTNGVQSKSDLDGNNLLKVD